MASDMTVKQAISLSQSAVATGLKALLDANSINAANTKSINIVPFGANQFLIVVSYT